MTTARLRLLAAVAPLLVAVPVLAQQAAGDLPEAGKKMERPPSLTVAAEAEQKGEVGEGVPAFTVRPGYRVTLAAGDLEEARFLQFGDDGTLYVSQPKAGKILALKDTNNDGTFDGRTEFVTDQNNVHSMDFHDGWLWFTSAQEGFAKKARDTDGDGKADEVVDVIGAGMENGIPAGGGHAFRGILVGRGEEAGRLYITVSDPGNISDEIETDRKTIYVFDLNSDATSASNRRVFSTGIRNTEKLQYRIGKDGGLTTEVWGADHGSDWYGRPYGDERNNQPITDFNPPDELNHYVEGGFYGHPFVVGTRVPRAEFADRDDIHELAAKTIPPEWSYPAHAAANGFTFLSSRAGEKFGGDHTGDLFQAQHGSWNRSTKAGYSVSRVLFDPMTGRPYGYLPVVVTLSPTGETLSRPVDVAEAPDGTLVFSSNQGGRIFRISPAGE